jgi:hypothetical protein
MRGVDGLPRRVRALGRAKVFFFRVCFFFYCGSTCKPLMRQLDLFPDCRAGVFFLVQSVVKRDELNDRSAVVYSFYCSLEDDSLII